MPKWLRQRLSLWKSTMWGWRVIIATLIFLWGLFGNYRSDFISPINQDKWRLPVLFPQVPWWVVAILLVIALLALLEGAYRAHERAMKESRREHDTELKAFSEELQSGHERELRIISEAHEKSVAALTTERDRLKGENDGLKKLLERPTLVGFFQDIKAHDWTKRGEEERDFEEEDYKKKPQPLVVYPPEPTGMLVVVTVGFVNDSPTQTTLLNFSLTLKIGDKTFTAMYPEERPKPIPGTWKPPKLEAEDREREKSNLLNYLEPPLKPVVRGHGVQGFLVFYFDGLIWREVPGQDWFFTLTITDAWGGRHDIVQWGPPPRPSQRL